MLKKIVLWAVALVLLACIPAQALTMVSVAADNSNLRSGPGDRYPVVWVLDAGFPLSVLESAGDWYRVEDVDGDSGWIHQKLVAKAPHMIVKGETADIRSGPSERYRLLGRANRGVVFQTLKVKEKWVKVKHGKGLTGWVSRSLLWGW